jgi:hypothetical protein
MNYKKLFCKTDKAGFVLCAALLGTLTGCVGYVDAPRQGSVYVSPPVETTVVVQDDYVYYPHYQVYYSSSRHQYAYLEGGAWVSRPEPRGVSVDVLLASPSVRMNFHDSPANHHTEIVRQYPRNWSPHGQKENPHDDQHGENNGR